MKDGLTLGQEAVITATVTPDMFAQFEGEVVHPAYSTVSMVYHMEWASRQIILPYLDDDEEGVGAAVKVKHIAPTGVGSRIKAVAKVSRLEQDVVITQVDVYNDKELIGTGEVKQVILKKTEIQRKLKESTIKDPHSIGADLR